MASVVATLFIPGGKSLDRADLDKVCDLLNIVDPLKSRLPTGPSCTYYLLLSANAPLPDNCGDTDHPLMRIMQQGKVVQ
jgi:hypothetical protein